MARALKIRTDVSETVVAPKPKIEENRWDARICQLPRESHSIRQLVVRVAADGSRRGHPLQGRTSFADR